MPNILTKMFKKSNKRIEKEKEELKEEDNMKWCRICRKRTTHILLVISRHKGAIYQCCVCEHKSQRKVKKK